MEEVRSMIDLLQLRDSIFVKKKPNNTMMGVVSQKNTAKSNPDNNWVDSNAPSAKCERELAPAKRVRK